MCWLHIIRNVNKGIIVLIIMPDYGKNRKLHGLFLLDRTCKLSRD